jgi:hypothetical protein
MNEETREHDEEMAILAAMQTPEFQRIQTEAGRRRFFKLATAYWDLGPKRRSRKARATVTPIPQKA